MALPKVFSFLSGKEPPAPENLLAIKIDQRSVTATSWSITDGKVTLGKVAGAKLAGEGEEHLVRAVDEAVSAVSVDLVPEPKKVIFGVWEDWVEGGKIKHDHLVKLRKLCKQLELSPLGFVTISEAVDNFLREVEGVPLTAILVGIDSGRLTVTMLRAGKNFGTHVVGFEDNVGMGLEKAIRQYTQVEFLPSRIIIYDGKHDLEIWKEKLVSYPWTQRLPFLHFPKVEVLPDEEVVRAVAGAGGTQLGGSLDLGTVAWPSEAPGPTSQKARHEASPQGQGESATPQDVESPVTASAEEVEQVAPEELGFAVERPKSELRDLPVPGSGDIGLASAARVNTLNRLVSQLLAKVKSVPAFLRAPKFYLPAGRPVSGQARPNRRLVAALGAAIIIVTALLLGSYLVFPSAQVTVFVAAQTFDRTMDVFVSLDETKESTAGAKVVGRVVEASLAGSKKGVASGKKLVGEKAKGSVKIFSVSSERSFASGTSLTSPDGLKFTLDQEVKVASGDAVTPATVEAGVTAADIGDKYNLAADLRFAVGSFPKEQYLAQSLSAFSGGNSRQATIVTKQDQDRLVATISGELESRAREELRAKIGPGETLLDKAITAKIGTRNFSRNADDEADSLTAELTMKFSGVVFDKNSAKEAFKETIASQLPAGYEMKLEDIQSDLVSATTLKEGDFILNFAFSGRAVPVLAVGSLEKKIVGLPFAQAKSLVGEQEGVEAVEIVLKPSFFSPIGRLPFRESQIKVERIMR